jgi:PAS domain-containing protein
LCFFVPAVYLATVMSFDMVEPFRTVSPPLLTIGLLLFSLLIQPGWMVLWAIAYSGTAALILLNPRIYAIFSNGFVTPEITSHKFRLLGFIATAVFACIFSWVLNRLRSKQEMLNHLILRMPMPVVVSDIEGVIHLANEKARRLLDLPDNGQEKGRYFDLLAPKLKQGKCIATYLNIFKGETSVHESLELEIRGKAVKTHLELLNSMPRKLVTMIQTED